MLQSFNGSASIHQSLCRSFGVGTSEGCVSPPLPGRLADGCGVKGAFSASSGPYSPIVHRPGDSSQLGEVGPPAIYLSSVSWHDDRYVP